MIRVGIIGLGMMGRFHYGAWSRMDGAEVVAVADTDPKRAAGDVSGGWSNIEGGAESLDMTRITGTADPHELIAMDGVDLVDICVPTPYHAELAVAGLQAGKHVVCEKPLARTLEQAREIVAAAEKGPGFCLPAMCIRFWPQWAWLIDPVRKGTYGKVRDATFRRVGSLPPGWFKDGKQSGGAILDLHLHDTDFIKFLFGKPRAVSSCGYVAGTGCVDHLVTRYLYDDGPMVHAEGGWGMADGFDFQMGYHVNFEHASAEYVMAREEPLVLYHDGKAEPIDCGTDDGYFLELAYMARCVASGTPPETVTAADAAESIAIVEAERRSVESGETVSL